MINFERWWRRKAGRGIRRRQDEGKREAERRKRKVERREITYIDF